MTSTSHSSAHDTIIHTELKAENPLSLRNSDFAGRGCDTISLVD